MRFIKSINIDNNTFNTHDQTNLEKIFISKDNEIYKNSTIYNDLKLFQNSSPIFNSLNKTHTIFGDLFLKNKLLNPTNNINLLNNQLISIKKINLNYDTIKKKIEKIKLQQPYLLHFFSKKDELINSIYFGDYLKFFNSNKNLLNIYTYINIYYPIYSILSTIILLILPYILKKIFNFGEDNLFFKLLYLGIPNINFSNINSLQSLITNIFSLVFFTYNLYIATKFSFQTINIKDKLYEILENINDITISCKKILSNNTYLNFKLNDINCLKNFKDNLNYGEILHLYSKIDPNDLISYIKFIGNIDYLVNLNTLLKNKEYCIINYINSKTPYLDIEDFYLPSDNSKVKNSIKVDDKNKNIIITGPNASGKSTIIKSLLLNILLSSTISIGCSKTFNITPFKYFDSYMNIKDTYNKSLFENQVIKITNIIKYIETLKENEFSFIIIDEIFNGTNIIDSISTSYSIAKKLETFKNNISIITTHQNYLTKLEKKGNFTNYRMKIERNPDINFLYKLEKGISKDYIALELLKKKNIDNTIIKKALEIKNKLSKNNNN